MFFQHKNIKIKLSHLIVSEKQFTNTYGISSEELMETYKLDEAAIAKIIEQYNETHARRINLTEEEKTELLKGQKWTQKFIIY